MVAPVGFSFQVVPPSVLVLTSTGISPMWGSTAGSWFRCSLHTKELNDMNLEQFWTRAPQLVRIGLLVSAIVGMVLGGAADAYWT